MKEGEYKKFFLMLAASFVVMYFAMFLSAASLSHIYLSLNELYMTLLMICPMSLIMLLAMKKMYANKKLNAIIIIISILVFILALILLRNQTLVDDKEYMKAMISHHSSAILSSKEANLHDSELKQLAEQIIENQEREIGQMKNILDRLN